jgi:hypothetical protein
VHVQGMLRVTVDNFESFFPKQTPRQIQFVPSTGLVVTHSLSSKTQGQYDFNPQKNVLL